MTTPSTQILVSNSSPIKGSRALVEMIYSRTGARNLQDKPKACCSARK